MAKINKRRRTIWSNFPSETNVEDWQADYEDWLMANDLDADKHSIYDFINDSLSLFYEDELINLDVEVDGVIIAFADLGLWYGRRDGVKIVGTNVKDILSSEYEYNDWYCDVWNVRCDVSHHDGNNHYLYRVAKDRESAERIIEKVLEGRMDEEKFRKATRSLRPYIAKVYGW